MKNRYQVSKEFKEECQANFAQLEKTGKIYVIEDNIEITESDNLVDFKIEDNCYVDNKFIGTAVAKKITLTILNLDNTINLEGKEIQVETGIIIEGKKEKVPFGNFILDSPKGKDLELKTTFTGYDYMIKFNNVKYKDNNKYPVNLGTFFSNLCNQVGLEAGDTNFVNSEIIITGNPFEVNEYEDITCKSVLIYIAELAGGFAKIGRDNKVYIKTIKNILNLLRVKDVHTMTVGELNKTPIKFLQNNKDNRVKDVHVMPVGRLSLENIECLTGTKNNSIDFILDGDKYFDDFIKSDEWGEINAVTLAVSEMETENITLKNDKSIKDNGLTEIVIEDSPFITNQKDRITATQNLWNALESMKYLPFKTGYYGYPYVDVGDTVYICDTKDKRYVSYVLNHTFTYNGGFEGAIETQAITKTQSNYEIPTNSINKRIKRVERKTDKINGIIEDVIEEQTEQGTLLNTTVQNVNSLTSSVTLLTNDNKEIKASLELKVDTKNLISEINASADQIKLKAGRLIIDSGNFQLDAKGNITCTNATIEGTISTYSSDTGYLALKLDGTDLNFYDYDTNKRLIGRLSTVEEVGNNKNKGIMLYCERDNDLTLGFNNIGNFCNVISINKNCDKSTPYIRNTADGTFFREAGGGIIVENGLIKNWSLNTTSGTVTIDGVTLEFQEGLLVNVY